MRGSNTPRLIELFRRQALRSADAFALCYGTTRVTYAELEARSNRLARFLVRRGIGPDVLVGIALARSVEMAVAVLGVLKAGAGYAPLDPTYPRERLAFMIDDSRAPLLLTTTDLGARLPGTSAEVVCLDARTAEIEAESAEPCADPATPEHLAYVIYTSGSTGTPKGVAMTRAPLENLIDWQLRQSAVGAGARTLQFAPLSFDVHFQEMFATWAAGGELVMVDDELRLDAGRLLRLLEEAQVARLFLPYVALQALADAAAAHELFPAALREVVTAGEQLVVTKSLVRFFERLPRCQLFNHYGPSETHVVTAHALEGPPASWPPLPPIGAPIDGVTIKILDDRGQPVAPGAEGELYLGGVAVARGYLHRPELTASKFLPDPEGGRLYRTGDLARRRPDGTYEFLGRLDSQVKVRGYRIELGEIEVALAAHPAVRQAVVVAREDDLGDKRLVAYVALAHATRNAGVELRRHLAGKIPEYMLPAAFVLVDEFPRTPSGKIDRRALPRPEGKRPDLLTSYVAPRTPREDLLCRLWAQLIKIDRVGVLDNFFELGGSSLLALQATARLQAEAGLELPVVQLFAHPTVRELAAHLDGAATALPVRARRRHGHEAVAIIGMAGRFPGARGVGELWEILRAGRDTTTGWTPAEIDPEVPASERDDPAYVRRRGVLDEADRFDAAFFGVSPREAELIDPQQRILLEVAWAALESAGHLPELFDGAIGVFAGTHNDSYVRRVQARPDAVARVGAFTAMVGNEKDYVATRIAHKLDLTGPALSIHTACSTSLVAITVAVENLLSGACDLALAGGAAVTVPQRQGHLHQDGGMLSDDGHTRPFDTDAHGTTFSDGAGMVVLRRLSEAEAAGDHILGVIRGAALNNDGAGKVSFTAPSVEGQAAVIATAQALAEVDPRSISYVEAHGTATPLGDPVEVEALTRAFRQQTADRGFCGLGSIKSNFGHLTAAAGVAGLIKILLALEHELLPPTVHFRTPSPRIDFGASPFHVIAAPTPWPRGERPRRAGVSSFGVGGTNAHAVIEEAPALPAASPSRTRQLLLLSARTAEALQVAATKLHAHLAAHPEQDLADVAFTLHLGRRHFSHRRYLVAADARDASLQLETPDPRRAGARVTERREAPVVFLFPGQGAQYVGMGGTLYRDEPLFRLLVDQCAEILRPHLGRDLREVLYPADASEEAAATLRRTEFTQAALFTVEYALANLWMSWGVRPALMVGHSVGELVCAVLAGVLRLEDALPLVAARGRLMQTLPPGTMLSVRLPAAQLEPRLPPELAIASSNGPRLCVAAGPTEAVNRLQQQLEAEGVVCKPLHTSHAFHSPMMDPAIEPFAALVRAVKLSPPKLPFVSTTTARLITDEEATDPGYWAAHLRRTVRFAEAIAEVWTEPDRVLLEVGPRTTLATLARQQIGDKSRQFAVSSLGDGAGDEAEWTALLGAVGQLWLAGVSVDARAFFALEQRRRVPLPTYPFERQRHWLASPAQARVPVEETIVAAPVAVHPGKVIVMENQSAERTNGHKAGVMARLRGLLEEASGIDFAAADPSITFLELGLDSLFLTQIALSLKRQFGVTIGFRQLLEELSTLDRLADRIVATLPAEAPVVASPALPPPAAPLATPAAVPGTIQALVEQQLRIMQQQLEVLSGRTSVEETAHPAPTATETSAASPYLDGDEPAKPMTYDVKKAFGAIARIHTAREELPPRQKARLDELVTRYAARTQKSKAWTQEHRAPLADPRVVTGFRPLIKELVYPIVCTRSAGARLWDLDGNEYVDALNGFGSNFLGHASPVVTEAIKTQVDLGFEIGPMQPFVGDCARLVCELTGHDRAAFCNTGSEAVMGAMRVARTVTGRNLIVVFSGSYHGIFDEVIVRGTKRLRSVPAAPGIMPESVENVLVLDYGTPESMALIKDRAGELAAVMVEPVQSRRPDFRPVEFLRELRAVTEQAGCAYIWDEVITGFRIHPGGAQAHFGVQADLATYGKVVSGGLPMGVIAGRKQWMDALDGGFWQFGDDSVPTAGVTYFAGTFVRHPLAMIATKATLEHLKQAGPALQEALNARTDRLARELNAYCEVVKAPVKIKHFGSLWKAFHVEDHPMQDLLFVYLRARGIHIWDGFPCFLSEAHGEAEVDLIVTAFKESVAEMQEAGFYPPPAQNPELPVVLDASRPPLPGARLGRDPSGNPAWYVPNPREAGKYLKLEAK